MCVYIYNIYVYIIYIYIYISHIYIYIIYISTVPTLSAAGAAGGVVASLPTLKPQTVLATLARVAAMLLALVGGTCPLSVDEHGLRVAIGHYVTRLLRAERMEYVAGQVVHLARLAVGRTSAGDVRLPELRRRDRARVSRRSFTATLSQRNASVIQAVR